MERKIFENRILTKLSKLAQGMTDEEIVNSLEEEHEQNKLSSIRNITVQFLSNDSEVISQKLVYKEVRFL